MAKAPLTTPFERWNSAMETLHSLREQQAAAGSDDKLERAVADQEELVLELEAPHLTAVLQKLKLLFDIDLLMPDQDGHHKRLIVEDLAALIGHPA